MQEAVDSPSAGLAVTFGKWQRKMVLCLELASARSLRVSVPALVQLPPFEIMVRSPETSLEAAGAQDSKTSAPMNSSGLALSGSHSALRVWCGGGPCPWPLLWCASARYFFFLSFLRAA